MRWLLATLPTLIFHGPPSCPSQRLDPCKDFLATMQHPAIVRRLDDYEFRVEPPPAGESAEPSLAVRDAAGTTTVRWHTIPSLQDLGKILNLMEGATQYLDADDAYDPALAALALGNAARGRQLLEELRGSADAEPRELATVWLGKLNGKKDAATVANLAKNGATPRVRFEAWMEMARLHLLENRVGDAAAAVEAAVEAADSPGERKAARLARQYIEERRSSVLGLGRSGELIYGKRTLQPRGVPKNTARVELRLDGKLVATAKRAPFASTLGFGRIPKRQVLEIAALDRGGKLLQKVTAVINERSAASSIELAEAGNEVTAAVRAPRGTVIEEVWFEWNGSRFGRFEKPPYRAPLQIAAGEPGVLRAVARFDDGTEVEDARLLNASGGTLTSDVHLMEVPVYFETAVPGPSELQIREKDRSRRVERVVAASEAPLRLALVLDASLSMVPHLFDLQEAALQFVERNLDARDETAIVGFGASVEVLRPTRNRAAVERAVLGLRAAGATPLHDAMVQALLDLQVGGSRRALVVFSDGMDTSSILGAGDVEEVARRVGVPIYVLSFIAPLPPEPARPGRTSVMTPSNAEIAYRAQRELAAFAKRSGGKAFSLNSLDRLGEIWNEIGADLRKQSLVLFRTEPGAGDEWRPLQISVKGGGELRAPAGVYVTGRGSE
ncbi:MAG TPA: VWA domain-containing protein [Thermoanaerobaculia bacterium]